MMLTLTHVESCEVTLYCFCIIYIKKNVFIYGDGMF
jgi:hypothetical protein